MLTYQHSSFRTNMYSDKYRLEYIPTDTDMQCMYMHTFMTYIARRMTDIPSVDLVVEAAS